MTKINKKGGIKSLSCNEIAKRIWEFCILNTEFSIHNITHISAAHIPGKHNILAELASRKFQDSAEWMLELKIFDYVTLQFVILQFFKVPPEKTQSHLKSQYAEFH